MSDLDEKKLAIISTLKDKSVLKQKVYDNTLEAFGTVKDILKNFAKQLRCKNASVTFGMT